MHFIEVTSRYGDFKFLLNIEQIKSLQPHIETGEAIVFLVGEPDSQCLHLQETYEEVIELIKNCGASVKRK
jgi:hypothetical protein